MYTISVRATELERSYPYGVVRQTADSVQLDKSDEERAGLFTGAAKLALPILEPGGEEKADNPELMYQRLHGLYWLIANLARQQPLLITIDDAQWADEASMAAERFLSLRIADLPMVLLLAARPAEVGQLAVPLAEILADPATVSIRPGPLSTDGAGRRIEALLGSGDPDFAAACHFATGGNPFLERQQFEACQPVQIMLHQGCAGVRVLKGIAMAGKMLQHRDDLFVNKACNRLADHA